MTKSIPGIGIVMTGRDLQRFKDHLATELFSMTIAEAHEKEVCIDCKKPPTSEDLIDKEEYRISALCHICFPKNAGKVV